MITAMRISDPLIIGYKIIITIESINLENDYPQNAQQHMWHCPPFTTLWWDKTFS